MTTTTIDGAVRRPPLAASGPRHTPLWGLPLPSASTTRGRVPGASTGATPRDDSDLLPGDPLPCVRPARPLRILRMVEDARSAGETTRGRPPPVSTAFVWAAQWTFLAAALLNIVLW